VPDLPRLLAPGGVAVLEVGAGQADAVAALWPSGFAGGRRDLGGHVRALVFCGTAGLGKADATR
jgi:release factor glutamine methyltransferase